MTHWRNKFKVHPATDAFPMMSDEELDALAADIKANGLTIPVLFWRNGEDRNGEDRVLIDGRNRLEAMERAGLDPLKAMTETFTCKDPVTHIASLNIHRRHLTKEQKADLIVAAHKAAAEASRQAGEVPKRHVRGKAGSEKDATKAAAVATAKELRISKRTVERSFAKADGKKPEPATSRPTGVAFVVEAEQPLPPSDPAYMRLLTAFHRAPIWARRRLAWNMDRRLLDDDGVEAARRRYVAVLAKLDAAERDAEFEALLDEVRGFTGKPQPDPDDDIGDIPAGLDRRRRP